MTTSAEQRTIYHWIAAGLGSGWLPKAPGTWGSLAALVPGWFILDQYSSIGLLIASVIVTLLGCWVCFKVLPSLNGDKDPGWIVIDEWAGQWLCLALLVEFTAFDITTLIIAFIAFRLFDIVKPWPVSLAEKLGPSWWSIMADDVVAGLMGAGAALIALQFAI